MYMIRKIQSFINHLKFLVYGNLHIFVFFDNQQCQHCDKKCLGQTHNNNLDAFSQVQFLKAAVW